MQSIFLEKNTQPDTAAVKKALGEKFKYWQAVEAFVHQADETVTGVWNFAGTKYGWSYRIKDKKRILVYMLPCEKSFVVSMVFGPKAMVEVLNSAVSDSIKTELQNAKAYAEGRGIRIEVNDASAVEDIKKLISIKVSR